MNTLQKSVVFISIVFFFVMYFGCDTKPKEHQKIEERRAMNAESTSIGVLLMDAKSKMGGSQSTDILALETQLEGSTNDSSRIDVLKQLSGRWFEFGHPEISGFYAEQIAESLGTEDSWSIAGTTYTICVQRVQEEKIKQFCTEKAVAAFENAISLNSENVQHKTNLALLYTENPPQENPMKGILMLVDLNKQFPENVGVLYNLGRLGIKTGQYEKAIQRLEAAYSIDPTNKKVICLLAQAFEKTGNQEKASQFQKDCEEPS